MNRDVSALTLEEKVSLLAGEDVWHLPAIPRLGIPRLKMSDGPSGVRGSEFTGGPRSACAPCGTALAATWDVDLVERVGRALADEARAKGAHVLLGPTVNMHRHPLAGRHFECFSEDPELTSRVAVAYIRGVQTGGVAACVKHFAANDSEFERFTISSEVPERPLREVYVRPFEAAVTEAGARAVMAAYNKLGGTYCSEHPELLTTILRDEWGFDGIVVSDWLATHSTLPALEAGLDVEMPGPSLHRGAILVTHVHQGDVAEEIVDRSVERVLRVAAWAGALDGDAPEDEREAETPELRALLREAAAAAIVLLRNDDIGAVGDVGSARGVGSAPLLPLSADRIGTIAVIGPNADPARVQGGGSAGVTPYRAVSPLDGIVEALGGRATVVHEPGCTIARTIPRLDERVLATPDGEPGLLAELFVGAAGEGEPSARLVARRVPMGWSHEGSIRLSGTFTPRESGEHALQVRTNGRASITLADARGSTGDNGRAEVTAVLDEGVPYPVQIELASPPERAWRLGLDLRHKRPLPEDLMERAVRTAADADVAVVVVGTDNDWETEGRDRTSLSLPGAQDELVERVVAVNPRTIVVVNSGAPVAMEWADRVPALLQLWFPGQECGHALADVLFGAVAPSGRLPTTFPRRLEDTPAFTNYPGEDGRVVYGEGLLIGRVTNTGDAAGAEVVQLYVKGRRDEPKELKAFAKVQLEPGQSKSVGFTLGERAFSCWDVAAHGWGVEPGDYDLLAAASATDVRSRAKVTIE